MVTHPSVLKALESGDTGTIVYQIHLDMIMGAGKCETKRKNLDKETLLSKESVSVLDTRRGK